MVVWLSELLQLGEVAEYWKSVIEMNEYQAQRFTDNIPQTMGTVSPPPNPPLTPFTVCACARP
jgi:hypothetical protein